MTVTVLPIAAGVAAGLLYWKRRAIAAWWARLVPPTPAIEPEPVEELDPLVAQVRRLTDRVTIAETVSRRLRVLIVAVVAVLIGLAMVTAAAVLIAVDVRHQSDQREADRAERTVAACHLDNDERIRLNKSDDAKVAIRQAIDVMQHVEIDGLLSPLTGDGTLTASQQQFRDSYLAGKAAVDAALSSALTAIDDARVPLRDCSPAGIAADLSTASSGG